MSDADTQQLEELLEISKKHTNNPPKLLGKRTSAASEDRSGVVPPASHVSLDERLEESPGDVNPFDLVAAAAKWRNREKSTPPAERDSAESDAELSDMIYSLQQYVNRLKGKLEEQATESS